MELLAKAPGTQVPFFGALKAFVLFLHTIINIEGVGVV